MCERVISVLPYNTLLKLMSFITAGDSSESWVAGDQKVPYKSWFHKFILWLLCIYICQTPGLKGVGMKLFANILLITCDQDSLCKFSWCMNTEGNQIQPSYGTSWYKSHQLLASDYFTGLSDPSPSDRARHNCRASEGVLEKQSNGSRFHKYLFRKACK